MASDKNKHGLSRNIPDYIKQKIRQNSKFGCIVPNCRNVIYEYEHLIPEFKDAKIHDPDKICLTCPNHNPRKPSKNGVELYSKQQLINFYSNIKETKELIEIKDNHIFSGFNDNIKVHIGGLICEKIGSLIEINGQNIFSFTTNPYKTTFAPDIYFNGRFEKPSGELLCEIKENEWLSNSNHSDLIYKNGSLTIFGENQKPIFSIKKIPIDNTLKIEDLDLWINPFHIFINNGELIIARHDLINDSYIAVKIEATIIHQNVAIKLSSENISHEVDFDLSKISYSGDYGLELKNNGIYIALGRGISWIRKIHILTCLKGYQSEFKIINIYDS